MAGLKGEIWDVMRAASATHLHLRSRLMAVMQATIVVDIAASIAFFFLERNMPNTGIHSLWDAFYWTTSQLLTISSTMPNPVTTTGEIICLILDIYAITVVSTLAGMFSAFFYRRGEERDPLHKK
ncbi:hypothetical protein [Halomonas elongata]|uniref:hypothetical protein n=1 Tax=Halomonas elongata TaxID=2746 RepID=UPI0011BF0A8E|nr:hypothetical protein [Halomonas elongata]